MACALYDPELGYYARPRGQVGRQGDFFTSVSVGPLFGRLLARHIAAWYQESGCPARWRIIEIGANDAALGNDIFTGLQELDSTQGLEYAIIEPLPAMADLQKARFPDAVIRPSATAFAAAPLPSFIFGNEIMDALPFHVVESDGQRWQELGVTCDSHGRFVWTPLGSLEIAQTLPVRPARYRTEIRGDLKQFLAPLLDAARGGRMLWIDYGYEREDYYHEARSTGTLRTFSSHRAGDDPLDSPGQIDITAHVDFTALAEAIGSIGGDVLRFESQSTFLTRIARPWLLEMEGRCDDSARKDFRSFQTLTHPGHLGSRFHVMEAGF